MKSTLVLSFEPQGCKYSDLSTHSKPCSELFRLSCGRLIRTVLHRKKKTCQNHCYPVGLEISNSPWTRVRAQRQTNDVRSMSMDLISREKSIISFSQSPKLCSIWLRCMTDPLSNTNLSESACILWDFSVSMKGFFVNFALWQTYLYASLKTKSSKHADWKRCSLSACGSSITPGILSQNFLMAFNEPVSNP